MRTFIALLFLISSWSVWANDCPNDSAARVNITVEMQCIDYDNRTIDLQYLVEALDSTIFLTSGSVSTEIDPAFTMDTAVIISPIPSDLIILEEIRKTQSKSLEYSFIAGELDVDVLSAQVGETILLSSVRLFFSSSLDQLNFAQHFTSYDPIFKDVMNESCDTANSRSAIIEQTLYVEDLQDIRDDRYMVKTGQELSGNVTLNDCIYQAGDTTVSLVIPTQFGSLQLNSAGEFTYISNTEFAVVDTFSYVIMKDGIEYPALALIDVEPTQAGPRTITVIDDYFTVVNGFSTSLDVTRNDFSDGNIPLEGPIVLQMSSQFGTATVDGLEIIYEAHDTIATSDTLTYRFDSENEQSTVATVIISIIEEQDTSIEDTNVITPNFVMEDHYIVVTEENGTIQLELSTLVTEGDANNLTYTIISSESSAEIVNGTNLQITQLNAEKESLTLIQGCDTEECDTTQVISGFFNDADAGDDIYACADMFEVRLAAVNGAFDGIYFSVQEFWDTSFNLTIDDMVAPNSLAYNINTNEEVLAWNQTVFAKQHGVVRTNQDTTTLFYTESCVYPGDANGDGDVTHVDVLSVGVGFGSEGPERPENGTDFVPYLSYDWTQQDANGRNYKHFDCDGNGLIDLADLDVIRQNYHYLPPAIGGDNGTQNSNPDATPIYFTPNSIAAGESDSMDFNIGTELMPADEFYGIALTFEYDTNIVEANSPVFVFNESWMGQHQVDFTSFQYRSEADGIIQVTITGIDQNWRFDKNGKVGSVDYTIKDNIFKSDLLQVELFKLVEVVAPSADGTPLAISNEPTISDITNSIRLPQLTNVSVGPNPVHNQVVIQSAEQSATVTITNITGQVVLQAEHSKQSTIDFSVLQNGVYTLQIKSVNGIYTDQIIKQ